MTTSTLNGENYGATLVPVLHEIQHEFGYLEHGALQEYSRNSGVPLYRLQAVASFFPFFRLTPPKKVTLRVCRDMACHMAGAQKILGDLQSLEAGGITVEGASCLGRCDRAPSACVSIVGQHDEYYYHGRSLEDLKRAAQAALNGEPPAQDRDVDHVTTGGTTRLDAYDGQPPAYLGVRKLLEAREASLQAAMEILRSQGGWDRESLEQFRSGAVHRLRKDIKLPEEVVAAVRAWQTESDWAKGPTLGGWAGAFFKELNEADLRGLGGAGIPASQKWQDVRDAVRDLRRREMDDRAFIVVNADESEPGTFKDREILLHNPHTVVEGVILAGMLTEATQGFIYIRHEYPEQIEACRAEIRRAEAMGFCGPDAKELGRSFVVAVFVSPGGYICGEQSALIEAMSDRRGEPRNMPPKLETNGLMDMPTLVSNVETYAWTPFITIKGGKTYANEGVNGWKGRRLFSISGDLKRPGVYEVPMGLPLRDLLMGEEYCQGIVDGGKLKAFAPSGPSGGFLPAKLTAPYGLPRKHTENKSWQELAKRRGFDPMAAELDILDLELELNLFRALSPTSALGAGMVVYDDTPRHAQRSGPLVGVLPQRILRQMRALPPRLAERWCPSPRTSWKAKFPPRAGKRNSCRSSRNSTPPSASPPSAAWAAPSPLPLGTVMSYFPDDLARHLTA